MFGFLLTELCDCCPHDFMFFVVFCVHVYFINNLLNTLITKLEVIKFNILVNIITNKQNIIIKIKKKKKKKREREENSYN